MRRLPAGRQVPAVLLLLGRARPGGAFCLSSSTRGGVMASVLLVGSALKYLNYSPGSVPPVTVPEHSESSLLTISLEAAFGPARTEISPVPHSRRELQGLTRQSSCGSQGPTRTLALDPDVYPSREAIAPVFGRLLPHRSAGGQTWAAKQILALNKEAWACRCGQDPDLAEPQPRLACGIDEVAPRGCGCSEAGLSR